MYQHVLLDNTSVGTNERQRFYSCINFVADECAPAIFYVNSEWHKEDTLSKIGIKLSSLLDHEKNILREHDLLPDRGYDERHARLVYMRSNDWNQHDESDRLPVNVPRREFVLSESEMVNRAYLQDHGLNATTVMLSLAAVGLDLMLPNINFEVIESDEITEFKETFGEERAAYLSAVADISSEAYERFKAADYRELLTWAEAATTLKLVPKARVLEEAVKKASGKKLQSAGMAFWKDGIPSIGSAYFSNGILGAAQETALQSFKSVTGSIEGDISKRTVPEYGYAMKIARHYR